MALDAKTQLFEAVKAHIPNWKLSETSHRTWRPLIVGLGLPGCSWNGFRKLSSLSQRLLQHLNRRRHRDLKQIRTKVRCANPANLRSHFRRIIGRLIDQKTEISGIHLSLVRSDVLEGKVEALATGNSNGRYFLLESAVIH
jgi:hypothetical protein